MVTCHTGIVESQKIHTTKHTKSTKDRSICRRDLGGLPVVERQSLNSATTGAWSLVPTSRYEGQLVARAASALVAST
jgi:hypothetical protein